MDDPDASFRSLFEGMPSGFALCKMVLDRDGPRHDFICLQANAAFTRLTGLENVVGRPASEVFPAFFEQDADLVEIMAEVAATGVPRRFEPYVRSLHRSLSLSLHSPQPGHFVVVLDEPTEGQMARALRESEARLRLIDTPPGWRPTGPSEAPSALSQIVSCMAEGVVVHAADGTIVSCNPAAERILGLSFEQLAGLRSVDPRWHAIHEDGSPFPGEDHPAMVTLRTGEPLSQLVMGVCKPDGTRTWISISSVALRPEPGAPPHAVVATFAEITERIAIEARLEASLTEASRLRVALDRHPAYVFMKNAEGRYLYGNQRVLELFGCTAEQLLGKSDEAFFAQDAAARLRDIDATVLGGAELTREFDTGGPEASRRVYLDVKTPLYATPEGGPAVGVCGISTDITARKRIEERHEQTRDQLSSVLEAAGDLIAMVDRDHRYILCNRAFEAESRRVYGRALQPGDLLAEALAHLPEDRDHAAICWNRALAGEDFTVLEQFGDPAIARDWYELHFSPVLDVRGQVTGALHVIRNVTERKRAEAELQDLQQRLAWAVDQTGVVYWEMDLDRVFTFNDRFYRLYATTAEREGGYRMPAAHYLREFLPREDAVLTADHIGALLRGEVDEFQREHRIRRRDGEVRDMHVRVSVLRDADGRVIGTRGSNQDVSDRKRVEASLRESEARFRVMADSAPVLIWVSDLDKRCTWFNKPWLDFTGRTMAQELGAGWAEGVHPDDLQRCLDIYVGHFDRRERFEMDYRLRRADGVYRWIVDVGIPRVDAEGNFAGFIGSCTEITERRAAAAALEERVAEAVAEIRDKDRMLISQSRQAVMGEMISNIAHQWRQPLNALGLVLANLQDSARYGELDAATLDTAVADAHRLIQKMSSTIADFRDFFRPAKGRQSFSVAAQIREAVALVDASYRHAGIEVEIQVVHDVQLFGVPNEYSQVVLNLLSNARQAIEDSHTVPARVSIRVERWADEGCVTVRDNGGGIPPDALVRIFEPYFSTKPGGTGIGLYMSRQIVEKSLGGRIVARNVEGGAEFVVRVPVIKSLDGGP